MKALTLIALISAFVSLTSAQTLQEKIAKLDKPKDVSFRYDKFKDRTFVQVKGVVFGTKGSRMNAYSIGVIASFAVSGQSITKDVELYGLTFYADGNDWRLQHDHHLIVLLDNEKLDFGPGDHDGEVFPGGVSESVYFELKRAEFEKIVRSKTVELQLGPFEGEITNRTLARTTRKFAELLQVGSVEK